jgi:hypothetical protein
MPGLRQAVERRPHRLYGRRMTKPSEEQRERARDFTMAVCQHSRGNYVRFASTCPECVAAALASERERALEDAAQWHLRLLLPVHHDDRCLCSQCTFNAAHQRAADAIRALSSGGDGGGEA